MIANAFAEFGTRPDKSITSSRIYSDKNFGNQRAEIRQRSLDSSTFMSLVYNDDVIKYLDPIFWTNKIKLARYRGHYSNFAEQEIIERYVRQLRIEEISRTVVDIGASDGVRRSNTLALFESGWNGVAFEAGEATAAKMLRAYKYLDNVRGFHCAVAPHNICELLAANSVEKQFGVLSLDIDGNDYWVLDSILHDFRPCLIVSEFNEKIPPPISFAVNYDPDFRMSHHFYGYSLAKLAGLLKEFDYTILEVEYNNVFLTPVEIAGTTGRTIPAAYAKGYADRPDRRSKFPQNANMEILQTVGPDEGIRFLNDFCRAQAGKYELSVERDI